ncbi:MAG: tRNA (guanosine(46)-N7)-methyltransferase TrmB [Lachnospiraceae bacterium]|jgi:tRNA (guanine-N7-)-methyltransferase|nr:tRNA (guanosine(46)-N7)-methyltransferase TrmB [Lachnospiraceae bacterium]
MRLRHVKGAEEMMETSEFIEKDPEQWKERWNEFFQNENPIHLEIGTGKGKFITTLAQQNPDINYIGIEKFSSVLVRALEKQQENPLPNLIFLREDANRITEFFGKEEVSRIYLNFSDPWPKDRHAKRRLTSIEYLKRYNEILKADGDIQFKTDNLPLFTFSLEQIEGAGWKVVDKTFDLKHSKIAEGNVMTEYEERFSAKGNPICKLIAVR